jgi:hypothetical protein
VAGTQIYTTFLTAYDATGTINAARRHEGQTVSKKVLWSELSRNASFGKLRSTNTLDKVVSMGIDAVAGVRWAEQIQNELCPQGQSDLQNRPGFLFSKGICIRNVQSDGTKLDDTLKLVDIALSGQSIALNFGQNKNTSIQVQPTAPLVKPVADLKSLHPAFNSCGKIQAVSDDTLGGFFPNHDANSVLVDSSRCDNGLSATDYKQSYNYQSQSGN